MQHDRMKWMDTIIPNG